MDSSGSKRRRTNASQSIPTGTSSNSDVEDNEDAPERRASYRSPTKASIARFNPSLLQGNTDIATGDVPEDRATSSLRGTRRGLNPTALRPKMTAPRLSASPTRETSSSPSRRARTSQSLSLARGGPSISTGDENEVLSKSRDGEAAESQVQAEEERSLMEEEKLAESVQRRNKRSRMSEALMAAVGTQDQSEPELPPTPAQLGLEPQPKRPAGVLSSSPLGKGPGRKPILKSSPLKPRPIPMVPVGSGVAQPIDASDRTQQEVSQQAVKGTIDEDEDADAMEDDPEVVTRKQRLDEFSKQLQILRSDVSFMQTQIRLYQEKPKQPMTKTGINRLVDILVTPSNMEAMESSPLKPSSLSTRLSAFLPFAKKPKPIPIDALLEEEILPSYKPIEGADPFSHLQAFTSFAISSEQRLTFLESEGALLNQQQILLSAPASMNLDIDLVLFSDTDTDAVEQLSLNSITPWAETELGTWIRSQAEDTADIAVIGWGSSRYLELSRTRARCWTKCLRTFPEFTSPQSIPPTFRPSSEANRDEIDDENMLPLLGKPSILLESRSSRASLLITWHINLDWIGDAESHISASASLPSTWIERDSQRNSLGKIPEAFEKLADKIGVFEAVKVMVGIVLGEG